jgi:putative transposase
LGIGLFSISVAVPCRNNGYLESFNNRLRKECLNRTHWTNLLEARVVIGDFKEGIRPIAVADDATS